MARRGGKKSIRDAIDGADPVPPPDTPPPPPPPAAPSGAPAWFEQRFEMRPGVGLFKKSADEKPDMWLSAPFTIDAETRNEDGLGWGLLLSWRDRDGGLHAEAFSRALFAGECAELRARLADGGLSLNGAQAARQAFAEYLNVTGTATRARSVARTGWHAIGEKWVYVLRDEVFGEAAERVVLQTAERETSLYGVSGTALDWARNVGQLCQGNSRLLFSAACGFAGPVLHLVDQPGGGINFVGKSQTGKTTTLRVAASVCGGTSKDGAAGYFRSWRATANGLESTSAEHNDGTLCLDELGLMDAREAGEAAYAIANGIAKARATRAGGARSIARWRLLFVSTGEVGIAEKNAEAGKRTHAGQEVRLVDIPADAGLGMGIFEQLHGGDSPAELAKQIVHATGRYYGTPLRAFLRALVRRVNADGPAFATGLRERVERLGRQWMDGLQGASGQVQSVASRFAVVAIAGELATAEGLTGWAEGEAAEAAQLCFRAFLAQRGTIGAREDEQAVSQLRAFVSKHAAGRFDVWRETAAGEPGKVDPESSTPPERGKTLQRVGWRRWDKLESGEWNWRYFLTAEGLAEALVGLAPKDAKRTLVERGFIVPPRGAEYAEKGVLSATYTVPREGKVRLYLLGETITWTAEGGE